MKYKIAFDLDNTLCNTIMINKPEQISSRVPRKEMVTLLKDLKKRGNKIVIFTRRGHLTNGRKLTLEWLWKHKIPYDILITEKPEYNLLIDDRAISNRVAEKLNAKDVEKYISAINRTMNEN